MKKVIVAILSLICFLPAAALADATYAYTNPTYIPTAISPPSTYTAPADYAFTTSNISTAVLQVSGTCTSLAAVVQGSPHAPSSTSPLWTTIPIVPVNGGASALAISGTGVWKVDVSGWAQTRLHITALTASCIVAISGTSAPSALLGASLGSSAAASFGDPCQSPGVPKSSVAVSQASSTTAAIVAASAGKKTYVCGFVASAVGTNPAFTFVTGTQTTTPCDTGASNLSGAIGPSATVAMANYNPGMTAFSTAASGQLCITTAATTDVRGVLTYVQQ